MATLLWLLVLSFTSVVQGQAEVESFGEAYWETKLGKTLMPKVVKDGLKGYGKVEASQVDKPMSSKKYRLTKPTQVYSEAAPTIDPTLNDDDSILFFLEQQLTNPTSNMKLHFTMSNEKSKFLPLQMANKIPFSSSKIKDIQRLLRIEPNSIIAQLIVETLTICEAKALKGEYKACTTSLEAMVNYVITHLGNKVCAISTEIEKETLGEYEVENAKKIKSGVNLVCHKMGYPYAVFYCHNIKSTDVYYVSLVGVNGKKVKAIAVCNKDTSSWNPRHLAFQVLKVELGSVPICHFLNEDTIVWVPSN